MRKIKLSMVARVAFLLGSCLLSQSSFAYLSSNPDEKRLMRMQEERISEAGEKIIPPEISPTQPNVSLFPASGDNQFFRNIWNEKISAETDGDFSSFFSAFATSQNINILVDKNVSLNKPLAFTVLKKPIGEIFPIVLMTQCLGYELLNNQSAIHIFRKSDQSECRQSNNVSNLADYIKDEKVKIGSVDFINIPYQRLLDNFLKRKSNGIFIYQGKNENIDKYTLKATPKSQSKIFQAILNAKCLSYRALTNKSLLIYEDPNQKDCKPLPSGSEIIVK